MDIKKLAETGKLTIGNDVTLKKLNANALERVFVASNVDSLTLSSLSHKAKLVGIEVEVLPQSNKDLGTLCKKSFSISVLGLLK